MLKIQEIRVSAPELGFQFLQLPVLQIGPEFWIVIPGNLLKKSFDKARHDQKATDYEGFFTHSENARCERIQRVVSHEIDAAPKAQAAPVHVFVRRPHKPVMD